MSPLLADALAALGLLTRFPVGWFQRGGVAPDRARSVWAFPLIGLIVGALAGLVYGAAKALGVPALLAAVWSLAASALMTGALHEDGLADVADGFGGGATRERKLEIMRDSRIGAYGALALILSSMLRIAAMASLADPLRVLVALSLAGALGRAGVVAILLRLRPARDDGLGKGMGVPPLGSAAFALIFALAAPFLVLPFAAAASLVLAASIACGLVATLATIQVGGHTGDILGAAEVVVECVALTAVAAVLAGAAT